MTYLLGARYQCVRMMKPTHVIMKGPQAPSAPRRAISAAQPLNWVAADVRRLKTNCLDCNHVEAVLTARRPKSLSSPQVQASPTQSNPVQPSLRHLDVRHASFIIRHSKSSFVILLITPVRVNPGKSGQKNGKTFSARWRRPVATILCQARPRGQATLAPTQSNRVKPMLSRRRRAWSHSSFKD